MDAYHLGKDIQTLLDAVKRIESHIEGSAHPHECHCGSEAKPAIKLLGVMHAGLADQIPDLHENIRQQIRAKIGARSTYVLSSLPPPRCGLVCLYPGLQTSECCWIDLNGTSVYGRMEGVQVVCGTSTILYYVDAIRPCA